MSRIITLNEPGRRGSPWDTPYDLMTRRCGKRLQGAGLLLIDPGQTTLCAKWIIPITARIRNGKSTPTPIHHRLLGYVRFESTETDGLRAEDGCSHLQVAFPNVCFWHAEISLVHCSLGKWPCEAQGESEMSKPPYAAYKAAAPYFDLVRGALGDLVDGEHFFDIVAEGIIYEVLYDFPGWPRIVQTRADLMAQFRGYGDHIALQSADKLVTHKADDGRVVVIEYEVHGTVLATGVKYNNRFCSIIEIENRKISHWRDYMDSLAAWNALTDQTP